jgi:hypothetical protein
MLEFDSGVIGRELPVGFGVMGIAISLPCGDLVDQDLLVRDAAVEALRRENGEFGFRHIEPTAMLWRVMPFEPLDETSCFVWRKSLAPVAPASSGAAAVRRQAVVLMSRPGKPVDTLRRVVACRRPEYPPSPLRMRCLLAAE